MSARSKSQYQRSDSNGQSADPGANSRGAARSMLLIAGGFVALCVAVGAAQALSSWVR